MKKDIIYYVRCSHCIAILNIDNLKNKEFKNKSVISYTCSKCGHNEESEIFEYEGSVK